MPRLGAVPCLALEIRRIKMPPLDTFTLTHILIAVNRLYPPRRLDP